MLSQLVIVEPKGMIMSKGAAVMWLCAAVLLLNAPTSMASVEAGLDREALAEAIKQQLDRERKSDQIPGMSYAVFNSQGLLFSDALGLGDTETRQGIDPETSLFRTASVSKLFTALAVWQLIEQGILSPDTPLLHLSQAEFVRKILSDNDKKPEGAQWPKVRLEHLLSHQAGFSKDVPGTLVFFNSSAITDHAYPSHEDLLAGLSQVEFLYTPGEITPGLKYSNLAMNMLARIVEAYNPQGSTFSDYVRRSIFKPLGMNHSFYSLRGAQQSELTTGYGYLLPKSQRLRLPKVFEPGAYDGSVGVATSAVDLARFGAELLRMAQLKDSSLLNDKKLAAEFFKAKTKFLPGLAWASGPLWQTLPGETLEEPIWTGHTGTGYGERAALLFSPERNLGVAILFNAADANREKYVKIISDLMPDQREDLRPSAVELVDQVRTFLRETVPLAPRDPEHKPVRSSLEKFVGTYYADVVGEQKVSISDDGFLMFYGNKLTVEDLNAGKFRFPMTAGPLFNLEPVHFKMAADGRVLSLRAAQAKVFEKTSCCVGQ